MDNIDDLLKHEDPKQKLAQELIRAEYTWIKQLVNLRKRKNLSQEHVAQRMGRSQSVVSDIETMSSDPRLSTLRRYALAIGATVRHRVFDASSTIKVLSERDTSVSAVRPSIDVSTKSSLLAQK